MSSIADSEIRTYGGPVMNPENVTLSKWTGQIGNDLVELIGMDLRLTLS